jgi:hypothetical protein
VDGNAFAPEGAARGEREGLFLSEAMNQDIVTLVEGASKLIALYGYWISFHDAAVESVLIERVGPTVTIRFRTNDAPSGDGGQTFQYEASRLARVVMRWHEVRDLTLAGIDVEENNWIGRLEFERRGDTIHTVIVQMDGLHGFILAEWAEVMDVEPITRERE